MNVDELLNKLKGELREHGEWTSGHSIAKQMAEKLQEQRQRIETLEGALKRKNDALRTWGQHKASCRKLADSRLGIDGPCGCGLFAALGEGSQP